jgi:hypothetical protein
MFTQLSDDLLLSIWDQLSTNKESVTLLKVCKSFLSLGKENGFVRSITVGHAFDDGNMMNFIQRMSDNEKTVRKLTMFGVEDPHVWIPGMWPANVNFDSCSATETIKPCTKAVSNVKHVIWKNSKLKFDTSSFGSDNLIMVTVGEGNMSHGEMLMLGGYFYHVR